MSEEIVVPGRGQVDRRAASGAGAPVHRPGDLAFQDAVDIEEAWASLSLTMRDRVCTTAGGVIERWAWLGVDDRAVALVLGRDAMVRATPAKGRAAYVLETVRLRPETARVAAVREDTGGRPAGGGGQPATGATLRLPSERMRAFVGNLPARAQQLLQDPFVGGAEPPRGEHHYLRTTSRGGFGRQELEVFCYLFDGRWLTCVTGEGVTYGRTFAAASWELTCRRVAVRPK